MGYVVPLEEKIPSLSYFYHQDEKGEWHWRLKTSSGRILANSSEGYKNEQECLDDIDRVKASKDARVEKQ